MTKKILLWILIILFIVSVIINVRLISEEKRKTDILIEKYTGYITHTAVLEGSIKGNFPSYAHIEILGNAYSIGEYLQYQKFAPNEFGDVYTKLPYDLKRLFYNAYASDKREKELTRLLEITKIVSKHLSKEVISDPERFQHAFSKIRSEAWEKNVIDIETASEIGW